jgi:hypothetical protein
MTPEEIRSEKAYEDAGEFGPAFWLREIAAQLAELREELKRRSNDLQSINSTEVENRASNHEDTSD